MEKKLYEIRKKLNYLIEKDADFDIILEVSKELDELIEIYMEEHYKTSNG